MFPWRRASHAYLENVIRWIKITQLQLQVAHLTEQLASLHLQPQHHVHVVVDDNHPT